MQYIYRRALSAGLKVDLMTLNRWHQRGFLLRSKPGMYAVADVDHFLAASARYFEFGVTPTWDDVRSGRIVFVRPADIRKTYDLTADEWRRLNELLRFAHIQLPGTQASARYCRDRLVQVIDGIPPSVSAKTALQAIGYASLKEPTLRATGFVPTIRMRSSVQDRVFVTEESFHRYLRAHLPEWISVEVWLEECEDMSEPLVTTTRAAQMLGWPKQGDTFRELERRRAYFIYRMSGSVGYTAMVSPLWIAAQLAEDRPLTIRQLGNIFGLDDSTAQWWLRKGQIVCCISGHAHTHEDRYLWYSCWLAYLREHCSPTLRQAMPQFLNHQVFAAEPYRLLGVREAAASLGCDEWRFRVLVHKGLVPCIVAPSGKFRFRPRWVQRVKSLV